MNKSITFLRDGQAQVRLPASKSIACRALMLQALGGGTVEMDAQDSCDDIEALRRGLAVTEGHIDVGRAGAALRFLTAYHAAMPGHDVTLTGDERLCERPMRPLIEALRTMGATVNCLRAEGHAPLRVVGRTLHGGEVTMRGDVSSQFVSALLMVAPLVGGLRLFLTDHVVSAPYIDMTLGLMERFGVRGTWRGNGLEVAAGKYVPAIVDVEGDWSAAAFWLALQVLLPATQVKLYGLQKESLQGDARIVEILRQMGVEVQWGAEGQVTASACRMAECCCSTYADLTGTPDLAPVLAVLLCLMGRPWRLTGLSTLRHKESDRMEALRTELKKVGYLVTIEGNEAMSWHFATCEPMPQPVVTTHGDHRIAMAMTLPATRFSGLTIADAEVVNKSYPRFWNDLAQLCLPG
ncbi:MAG: 3-phosphoshikimate 1-carboxyvinyltransferase [Muribaculaceae bacterium]|nr:3-phosphoshikimate 1-carboxyvinyltransferase [Muribaculaceae bacterium]